MEEDIKYLVKCGESKYSLVYAKNAVPAVLQAAKEIAEYVFKVSGAIISAVTDAEVDYCESAKYISLGENDYLNAWGLSFDFTGVKSDGYRIKTKGNSVFIVGKTAKSVLYAAYEFIERFLGVKFLAYDYTHIPHSESVVLPETDFADSPAFSDRTFLSSATISDGVFASKMRNVNEFVPIDERYGGGLGWFNDPKYIDNYVHNTVCYVSPEKYYDEHKDWFFVEDGIPWDLCLSNAGITEDGRIDEDLEISPVKIAVRNLKTFIKNSDESIKYFMIGQNDHDTTCNCAKCQINEKKYKRSGMNIRFVNAIGDEIEKWMKAENIKREIYICTFAYQYSQSAPVDDDGNPLDKTVIPRDNVIVRLAPIQADNYYGMLDPRQNERTRNIFSQWLKVAKKTMIWDYHTNYTFYFAYYPTMHVWKENLDLYRKMHSEYVLMQSDHSEPNDWKANMETYVGSKMLWNPDRDPFEIRDEYISLYYAEIAEEVRRYIKNFEDNYAKKMSGEDAPINTLQCGRIILHPKYYGMEFLNAQYEILDEIYKKINVSAIEDGRREFLIKQADRLKLSTLYTQVVGIVYFDCKEYYGGEEKKKDEIINSFFDLCAKLKVERTGETITVEKFKEICKKGVV